MWFKYGLKVQKLLDQGVWGHDALLMPGACGAYMRNLNKNFDNENSYKSNYSYRL